MFSLRKLQLTDDDAGTAPIPMLYIHDERATHFSSTMLASGIVGKANARHRQETS